jgi:hypothetical protein
MGRSELTAMGRLGRGKPAEPGGGALPPLHRRPLFEHVFDTVQG